MSNPLSNRIIELEHELKISNNELEKAKKLNKIYDAVSLFCSDCIINSNTYTCGLCPLNEFKDK